MIIIFELNVIHSYVILTLTLLMHENLKKNVLLIK